MAVQNLPDKALEEKFRGTGALSYIHIGCQPSEPAGPCSRWGIFHAASWCKRGLLPPSPEWRRKWRRWRGDQRQMQVRLCSSLFLKTGAPCPGVPVLRYSLGPSVGSSDGALGGFSTGFSASPEASSGASIFWEIMWTFLAGASMVSGVEGRKPFSSRVRVEA